MREDWAGEPPGMVPFRWSVSSYNVSQSHLGAIHVLTGNITAVAADFRVLLFPLRGDDPLPSTVWSAAGEQLELTKPDGTKDTISFAADPAQGYPRISVAHEGAAAATGRQKASVYH